MQKTLTDPTRNATPTPPHRDPVKALKESRLLESGYVLDHVGLRKAPNLVDHKIATRLMNRPSELPRPQVSLLAAGNSSVSCYSPKLMSAGSVTGCMCIFALSCANSNALKSHGKQKLVFTECPEGFGC